jgi:hypothetical protein
LLPYSAAASETDAATVGAKGGGGGDALFALPAGSFVAVGDAELAEDLGHVELDAVEANAETAGNLLV